MSTVYVCVSHTYIIHTHSAFIILFSIRQINIIPSHHPPMSVYPTNTVEVTRPVTLASSGRITLSTSVTVGDRVVKAASKQAATARSAAAQNLMTFSRAHHTPQPKEPAAPATQEDVPAPTVPIHATGGEAPPTAERRTPTHKHSPQHQRPTNNNHVILFLIIFFLNNHHAHRRHRCRPRSQLHGRIARRR